MKKTVFLLLSLCFGSFLFAEEAAAPSARDVNYAFGVLLGQSLASTGLDFDLEVVAQALRDSLGPDAKPSMDAEKAKEIVSAALQQARVKADAVKVEKEKAWLTEHAKKDGVVTTATGLQYEVLKKGTGPLPTAADTVKVDYVGTLVDGTEFDSSVKRGEPAVFPLNQVIPAWTEGIQLMPVGSKYRFTIPSSLAYGPEGAGGVIPPYATLVFEVDLMSIEAAQAASDAVPDAPVGN